MVKPDGTRTFYLHKNKLNLSICEKVTPRIYTFARVFLSSNDKIGRSLHIILKWNNLKSINVIIINTNCADCIVGIDK